MKKNYLKWLAFILALAMLLSGCSGIDLESLSGLIGAQLATPFSEMEYTRPDMLQLQQKYDSCCKSAPTETDVDALLEKIWDFYNAYNSFYTNYNLSSIYYFKDMTDIYWEQEYNYCLAQTAQVDGWLDELFYTLADCPLREKLEESDSFEEGFFDSYVGDSIWDETFTDLMNRQSELEGQYYDLCAAAQEVDPYSEEFYDGYGAKMAQLFVELVALRQEIAAYAGYDDYPSFAYDFYHYRDYTPAQAQCYLEQIGQELVPLYTQAADQFVNNSSWNSCAPADTFAYVQGVAEAMGGTVKNAFQLMQTAQLYDITYSEKKYNISFEVYLTDYFVPYVFINPEGIQRDKLTFAHEFGHFCNDYVVSGITSSVDVAEVFSQGMEYLSLCYAEDAGDLEQSKMLDGLSIFVEQAAYALFEHEVYALEEEALTAENVQALYEKIGKAFGFDIWEWDSRDYVQVTHFYMAPMYIVSYVVSNDVAMQMYQLEKEESGKGLELYTKELSTMQPSLLAFVEEAQLVSPFDDGRIEQIRKTFETCLMGTNKAAA